MKFSLVLSSLFASALALVPSQRPGGLAPLISNEDAEIIPDEFVVIFRDSALTESSADSLINTILASARVQESSLIHRYQHGFAAVLNQESLELVRERPEVEFVEPNQVVFAHDTQQNPPSWGLARISQRQFRVRNLYTFPASAGEDVDVYIVDTVCLSLLKHAC